MVFDIAYDIILTCLNGDCFVYKLMSGGAFKSHEIVPYIRLPLDFSHTHQCIVDKNFRVLDARHFWCAIRIGLERGFIICAYCVHLS